jgi:hypothetical protein
MGHKRRAQLAAKFSGDTKDPVAAGGDGVRTPTVTVEEPAAAVIAESPRCRVCGRDDTGTTVGGLIERHRPRMAGPDGPYIKAVPCAGGLRWPEVVTA